MPTALDAIDPLDPAILADPLATDRRLRAEAPVLRLRGRDVFLVSTHARVAEALRDPGRFASRTGAVPGGALGDPPGAGADDGLRDAFREQSYPLVPTLLANDPPDHARFREAAAPALAAARATDALAKRARALLDRFAGRGGFAARADYALPLASDALGGALGVPAADRERLSRWADGFGPAAPEEEPLDALRRMLEFQHSTAVRIDEARRSPGTDVVSRLVGARPTSGDPLDLPELLSLLYELLVTGRDTTAAVVTEAVQRLAHDAELRRRLAADPGRLPAFVEEVLRLASPVSGAWRRARADTTLGGVSIPAGSLLLLRIGSANRDEAVFADPDRLDLERANAAAHLAFGAGPHDCPGAGLARAALDTAARALLERAAELSAGPATHVPGRRPCAVLRPPVELRVSLTPR